MHHIHLWKLRFWKKKITYYLIHRNPYQKLRSFVTAIVRLWVHSWLEIFIFAWDLGKKKKSEELNFRDFWKSHISLTPVIWVTVSETVWGKMGFPPYTCHHLFIYFFTVSIYQGVLNLLLSGKLSQLSSRVAGVFCVQWICLTVCELLNAYCVRIIRAVGVCVCVWFGSHREETGTGEVLHWHEGGSWQHGTVPTVTEINSWCFLD